MASVTEEARKEGTQEVPYRVASPEFFFLLQRIDRLDEKLTAEIAALRQEVRTVEAGLRQELGGALRWVIGLVLTTLGLVVAAALKVWL